MPEKIMPFRGVSPAPDSAGTELAQMKAALNAALARLTVLEEQNNAAERQSDGCRNRINPSEQIDPPEVTVRQSQQVSRRHSAIKLSAASRRKSSKTTLKTVSSNRASQSSGEHPHWEQDQEQDVRGEQPATNISPGVRPGRARWVRNLISRYSLYSAPFSVSIHTWAFTHAADPKASGVSVLWRLYASCATVVIQIIVLIAIINESTRITPCEVQDDCNPGSFCMLQDIHLLSQNILDVEIPPEPIRLPFQRRCWDCVYALIGVLSGTTAPYNEITFDVSRFEAIYGKENSVALLSLFDEGTTKCLEEDRYPVKCDALIHFQQTLTGANVLVLIVSAIILALPLIADFEQALTDAELTWTIEQNLRAKRPIRLIAIQVIITFINCLRMGVLPAMTTISTSALLLYTGASTQNILLNFAAISIVTTLDDQLMELFLHPEEREHLEQWLAHELPQSRLPWLLSRTLLVAVTTICMPIAIINIDPLTQFVHKRISLTWNINPGFKPDSVWTNGIIASDAVPCESVYATLDFVGFCVGVLTLLVFVAYYNYKYSQQQELAHLATKVCYGFIVPVVQCFVMLFLGQQLLSKLGLGDLLQQIRPVFDNLASRWAAAEQITTDRLLAELGAAFPPSTLRAYMINYIR